MRSLGPRILVLGLLLAACGGGSGGEEADAPSPLAGEYHSITYEQRTGGIAYGGSDVTIADDGSFIWSSTLWPGDNMFSFARPYLVASVDAGGVVVVNVEPPGEPVTPMFEGGVGEDGSVIVLGSVSTDVGPNAALLIRKTSSAPTLASALASGHIVTSGPSDDPTRARFGTLQANGANRFEGWMQTNSGGSSGLSSPIAWDLSVLADGRITALHADDGEHHGAIDVSGELAAWASSNTPWSHSGQPLPGLLRQMAIHVEAPNQTTATMFDGRYAFVRFEYVAATDDPRSACGVAVVTPTPSGGAFDFEGRITRTEKSIGNAGLFDPGGTAGATYVTDITEGGLTINRDGNEEDLVGSVSASGRFALVSGGSAPESVPAVWLFVRIGPRP